MKAYTASDFIDADITVKRIRRVEHSVSNSWARANKLPRDCEGLLYFVSGEIEYYFDDYSFTASPGQVLKLPGGIPYNGKKLDSAPLELYLIDFEAETGEFSDFPIPNSFYPTDHESVIKAFCDILALWRQNTICSRLECKNAVSAFLCSLAKDHAVNGCHYDDRSRILSMCEYIKKNSNESTFRVSDAAEHFHISEAHLRRIFSEELHTSPAAYLADIRIERAKSMLVSRPGMTVSQVADECGYSSVYYFSSAFHEAVGVPPTSYRVAMSGGADEEMRGIR